MTKVTQIQHIEADTIIQCFKCIEDQIRAIKSELEPKRPTLLVSRKEAALFFGVTTVTIDDWTKKGILKSYKMANRVYYKRSEIESALIEVKTTI